MRSLGSIHSHNWPLFSCYMWGCWSCLLVHQFFLITLLLVILFNFALILFLRCISYFCGACIAGAIVGSVLCNILLGRGLYGQINLFMFVAGPFYSWWVIRFCYCAVNHSVIIQRLQLLGCYRMAGSLVLRIKNFFLVYTFWLYLYLSWSVPLCRMVVLLKAVNMAVDFFTILFDGFRHIWIFWVARYFLLHHCSLLTENVAGRCSLSGILILIFAMTSVQLSVVFIVWNSTVSTFTICITCFLWCACYRDNYLF